MVAAQTGHEEDKHTGMQGKKQENKEEKNEKRKVGSKAQKQVHGLYPHLGGDTIFFNFNVRVTCSMYFGTLKIYHP